MRKTTLVWLAAVVCLCVLATSANASDAVLAGNYLRVGVNNSGGLIDGLFTVGIDYDAGGTGTWTGFDFLKPGTPYEFYAIGVGGSYSPAGYNHGNPFGSTTSNTSAGNTLSATTTGGYAFGLNVAQNLSYDKNSGFIDFHVQLTNATSATLLNVVYARGLDPDQDVYAGGGFETTNVIVSGDMVSASAPVTDWTIAIYSNSAYAHTPSVRSDWSSNPYSLLSLINNGYGDYTINMAWDIGDLDPGETAIIDFQYRIAETHQGVVVPEPVTMFSAFLGIGSLGAYIRRRMKKQAAV